MIMIRTALLVVLSGLVVIGSAGFSGAQAQDRASRVLKKNDADGDGRISRAEWSRRPGRFKRIDSDGDGYLTLEELRARFGGGVEKTATGGPDRTGGGGDRLTTRDALDRATLCGIGRGRRTCDGQTHAIARGLFETGLRPRFPANVECRDIDEHYAIDYTWKRNREAYHGGIDMPAPYGTPMIAAAAGTVVAVYRGETTRRGMEITVRHSPEDTGIPLWIYTQYAHFDAMPKQIVGQRVRMGEVLGPTGNSGLGRRGREQSTRRRPAIHFAVWYSTSPKYVYLPRKIIPVDGYWMDPNALFRKKLPLDSQAMKALPTEQKQVSVSVMLDDGQVIPADTRIVWPYTCKRR